MGIIKIISYFLILCVVTSCKLGDIDDECVFIKVQYQEILYDSTYIKDNKFSIKLLTYLEFTNNTNKDLLLERKKFNDFYIILRNDTLPLILKTNKTIKSISAKSYISIKYISYINQLELEYDNKKLEKEIENSVIMNYNNEKIIMKNDDYFIRPLITLWKGPPDNNSIE